VPAYKHILFATDFSEESEPAAQRAADLARRYAARLSLIHVVELSPVDYGGDQVLPIEIDLEQSLAEEAKKRLARMAERLGAEERDRHLEIGSTKSEIIRIAAEIGVDLIVVGSHGRRGLALLLGSTANAVLHSAPCDVLAVRVTEP